MTKLQIPSSPKQSVRIGLRFISAGLVIALAISPAAALAATQLTKQGITWTFDKDYQVGQYVNGDYWVLASSGTVKVTSVSPAPTGSGSTYQNGSMVNPLGGSIQGYDGRIDGYTSSKSVAFPVTLSPGSSLVSTQSRNASAATLDIIGASCNPDHNYLQRAAVLTVVSAVPASTSFRPPYCGSAKPVYLSTQVNRALLPRLSLSTKPSVTTLNTVAGYFQNVWLDHKVSWNGRMMHPISNMPGYGRDMAVAVSQGAVLLTLDYTADQIEPLLINYIQLGIDLFGMSQNGTSWPADGGHESGRKWPIIFAGIMLNNSQMKAVNVDFGEDDQTYYGVTRSANSGQTYVAWFGRDCVSAYQSNGCSGAGTKDCRASTLDRDACQDYRNCCTSYTWVGEALAAQLMNAEALWNHGAFFDYVDRWMAYGKDPVVGSGDWIQPGAAGATYIADMWKQYRPLVGGTTPSNSRPVANAGPDQTVLDSDNSGSHAVTLDGSASTDSDGTIVSYSWAEGSSAIATGQKPTVNLTTGQHTIVLTVTDNGGLTSQDTVVITVTSPAVDTTPPTVISANCTGNSLELLFSEALDAASAQTLTNYAIDKGISITQAAYQASANKVILTTSAHNQLETYNLTVSNVRDSAGNTILTMATPYTYSPGLVGYWEFRGSAGTAVQDSSGLNNPALLAGASLTGQGQVSLVGPGQAVQVPTNGWNASAGTITLHAKVSSSFGDQYLFGHTVGTWTNRIQLFIENGSLCLGIGDRHLAVAGAVPMTLSTWYDVALTWNGSAYNLYVDGTSVSSGTYTGLNSLSTYADIGNDGYTGSRTEGMTGQVENTRVYSRALSAAEIGAIYNRDRSYLFAPIGDKTVDAGSTLNFTVVPVSPTAVISLTGTTLPMAPAFVNNNFSWTPAAGTYGTYTATFTAVDGVLSDSETININVVALNRPPVIAPLSSRTLNEGQRITATVNASDPDGQTTTVTAAGLPRGAVFANGIFDWTPGLDQAGTYTVQFTASDGQLTATASMTITVLDASGSVSDIVIDNSSSNTSFTGTWAASGATGSYGPDSLWSRDGDTYTWIFRPTISGNYSLSMWWTQWPSRSSSIPVTIQNSAGSATVYINQLVNGGKWNSLGAYTFLAGSAYNITIKSQPGPSSTCADAIKLTYMAATPAPTDTIIDNKDAATARTGTWAASGATGYYGSDSVWSRDGDKFTWYFTPSRTGQYQLSMWWTTWPSRSASIPVSIANASAASNVTVNQQLNGSKWNLLGTYSFNAGTRYAVTMTSQPDPTSTCADAIKFVFVQ